MMVFVAPARGCKKYWSFLRLKKHVFLSSPRPHVNVSVVGMCFLVDVELNVLVLLFSLKSY